MNGIYELELPAGTYTMTARYIGYKTVVEESVVVPDVGEINIDFLMEGDSQTLGEVSVIAVARRNTEAAQVQEQKRSPVIQTGESGHIASCIRKTAAGGRENTLQHKIRGQGRFGSYTPRAGRVHHRREVRHGPRAVATI